LTHIIINHSLTHLPPPPPDIQKRNPPHPISLPPHINVPDLSGEKPQFRLNNTTGQYIIIGTTKLKHSK
jgi:hypothetical protein